MEYELSSRFFGVGGWTSGGSEIEVGSHFNRSESLYPSVTMEIPPGRQRRALHALHHTECGRWILPQWRDKRLHDTIGAQSYLALLMSTRKARDVLHNVLHGNDLTASPARHGRCQWARTRLARPFDEPAETGEMALGARWD